MPFNDETRERLCSILGAGLTHLTNVPADIQLTQAPAQNEERLRLARNMMISLLRQPEHEAQMEALFGTLQRACQDGSFANHALDLANQVQQLLSLALRFPQFLDAFDANSALVTLYYFIVSVMLCAEVGVNTITQHEATIVSVAVLLNRVLLNRQVYETSRSLLRGLARACGCLCARMSRGCSRAAAE